jgi:hypothetical protein
VTTTTLLPDPLLTGDVLAHLEAQLLATRRMLQVVLEQGAAIRARDVHRVVQLAGILQAETQRRAVLDGERSRLLDRAGSRLGVPGPSVTLTLLQTIMDPAGAQAAQARSAELRGLLDELQREHTVNRAMMQQELAFLDHLLRLADGDRSIGYDAAGERPAPAPTLVADHQPVFDLQA